MSHVTNLTKFWPLYANLFFFTRKTLFLTFLSKSGILRSAKGRGVSLSPSPESAPLLGANVSADKAHFMQNSCSSRKGILDFIAVFG